MPNCFRRNEEVITQHGDENLMLFDMTSGHYYTLNDVGARIWALCDGEKTIGEVADQLEREFDAPREAIAEDLGALIADLLRKGLLLAVE